MERPTLENLSLEQIAYLEYLEGCLNGSSELILALNTASRVFALDIDMICSGETTEGIGEGERSLLTLLSGDSKDKTFDRIMVLFDKFDKIKALSQHFKDTKPQQQAKSLKLRPGDNVFETTITAVKNGNTKI